MVYNGISESLKEDKDDCGDRGEEDELEEGNWLLRWGGGSDCPQAWQQPAMARWLEPTSPKSTIRRYFPDASLERQGQVVG